MAVGPDYQVRTLSNGLTVLVVEDHALPLVTVEIGVRNGDEFARAWQRRLLRCARR